MLCKISLPLERNPARCSYTLFKHWSHILVPATGLVYFLLYTYTHIHIHIHIRIHTHTHTHAHTHTHTTGVQDAGAKRFHLREPWSSRSKVQLHLLETVWQPLVSLFWGSGKRQSSVQLWNVCISCEMIAVQLQISCISREVKAVQLWKLCTCILALPDNEHVVLISD